MAKRRSAGFPPEGPNPINVALGHRIRVRRRHIGITQKVLAEYLGVTFQQIQKYECGTNRLSFEMMVRIAEKLNITVAELAGEGGTTIPNRLLGLLTNPYAIELLTGFAKLPLVAQKGFVDLLRGLTSD